MKTFAKFLEEAYSCEAKAYDAAFMSGAQVIRTGEGGRIGAERRKTAPERTRTKRGPGGTTLPAKPYEKRSDAGIPRPASTRVQEPTKERGSAALSPKEAQRKAYLERKEREAGKKTPTATQLLSKKKEAEPKGEKDERTTKYQYTRPEKKRMVQAGKRLHADIIKGRDKPAAHYQPKTDT